LGFGIDAKISGALKSGSFFIFHVIKKHTKAQELHELPEEDIRSLAIIFIHIYLIKLRIELSFST